MADMMTKYAASLFNVSIDRVTSNMRNYAKQRAYMRMYSAPPQTMNRYGSITLFTHEYRERVMRLNDADGVE